MDPDDNEELLRLLALAITRLEDATADEARPLLFELALRIRQLLLTLPPGSVARSLQWPQIRGQIALLIMQLNDTLAQLFWSRLVAADAEVVRILNELYGLRPPLQPRSTSRVLDTTRILTTPVSDLFAVSPTGMSPFSVQLLRLLERSVGSSILNDDPTEAVAAKVLTTRTRGGAQIPYIARGTIANAWIERFRSLIAAALWSTITPNQLRAAALVPAPPRLWRWNAILDPRTCPICRPLHNTTAPSPDAFPNGAPPLHPRCVSGGTYVTPGALVAAFRRVHRGNLIAVRTDDGGVFAITPQHPVLTATGWARGCTLRQGDDLVSHSFRAPAGGSHHPDLYQVPTRAEDLFDALRAASPVPPITVPATSMQFHGDGTFTDGEVEIVFADRVLKQHIEGDSRCEELSQLSLVARNPGLIPEAGLSDLDALLFTLNSAACGSVSLFQQSLALLKAEPSLTQVHRFTSAAHRQPEFIEPSCDYVPAAPEMLRQCLDTDALPVQLTKVRELRVIPWEGHVYDFTSLSSIYSIATVIAHNCRCIVLPA